MGKFHETLNQFGQTVDLPDEFRSAISSAYDEDFSSADAKVNGLETAITEKDSTMEQMRNDYESKIRAVKAVNYDLLKAGPSGAAGDINNNPNHDEDDPSDVTIHDLFG